MSGDNENAKLRFKAAVNKEKNKVLFAESDSHFADILLSFLTLPLGKVLEKEYEDKPPDFGGLSNLYRSLRNLDGSRTEDAKKAAAALLNPTSDFEAEYQRLKLDITASSSLHTKCLYCGWEYSGSYCGRCLNYPDKIQVAGSKGADDDDDGVFTLSGTSFVISDDLQIFPSETGLLGILKVIGITDMDGVETIQVEFGLSEIMSLLKASLASSSPLTDVILNRANSANVVLEPKPKRPSVPTAAQSPTIGLKVTVQKSTGKVLHAQPKGDFMKVLCSIFSCKLGSWRKSIKAMNSLYRSAEQFIDDKYFKKGMKMRLIKLDYPRNNVPLEMDLFSGQRSYYLLMDDFTVMPFSVMSTVSALEEQKIPISDIEEVELQIGKKEALSIVRASLSSSTTVLTDALMNHRPDKRVKRES